MKQPRRNLNFEIRKSMPRLARLYGPTRWYVNLHHLANGMIPIAGTFLVEVARFTLAFIRDGGIAFNQRIKTLIRLTTDETGEIRENALQLKAKIAQASEYAVRQGSEKGPVTCHFTI